MRTIWGESGTIPVLYPDGYHCSLARNRNTSHWADDAYFFDIDTQDDGHCLSDGAGELGQACELYSECGPSLGCIADCEDDTG